MINLDDYDVALIRKREQQLAEYSAQIGRMCTLWSGLEFDATIFLTVLAPIDDPIVKNTLVGVMKDREKFDAIKVIGFKKRPNDAWYEDLDRSITTITEKLRLERNRMVHDYWLPLPDDDGVERIRRVHINPKVVNVQSRSKMIKSTTIAPIDPEAIANLCDRIVDENVALNRLRRAYERFPLLNRPPSRDQTQNQNPG